MDSVIPEYYLNFGLDHSSPSQFTKPIDWFVWNYALNDAKYRRKRPPAPNMEGGNAVQGDKNRTFIHPTTEKEVTIPAHGLGAYLFEKQTVEQAIMTAEEYCEEKQIIFSGDDFEHFGEVKKRTPKAIRRAVNCIKEFGVEKQKDLTSEQQVEWQYPGIDITSIGFTDIQSSSHVYEFKTIWFRKKGRSKKTNELQYASNSLPKKPSYDHLLQTSFYAKATGKEPVIIYVTGNPIKDGEGYIIFTKENCDDLTKDGLEKYIEDVRQTQQVRQNLFKICKSKKDLTKLVQLNFNNSFYWNNFTTQEKEEIQKIWV
jgi:hypothetical protein